MGRSVRVAMILMAVAALLLPGAANAQARKVKVKKTAASSSAAGVISQARAGMAKRAISGSYSFGYQCVGYGTANTHSLGWISENVAMTIDFMSDDESDPIAVLSSIQFENGTAGGERFNSDDEGGDLNPYFRMMKPYAANWVLTVGAADDGIACYSFKVTLQ